MSGNDSPNQYMLSIHFSHMCFPLLTYLHIKHYRASHYLYLKLPIVWKNKFNNDLKKNIFCVEVSAIIKLLEILGNQYKPLVNSIIS
jgi:hypothetical protein